MVQLTRLRGVGVVDRLAGTVIVVGGPLLGEC